MADIDDLVTPPNAGAYEQEELRKGPPLTYVGEKSRATLYHIHAVCLALRELPAPKPDQRTVNESAPADTRAELIGRADTAFYYALVAFLALYNSLGRLGEWELQADKLTALRELSRESFDQWVDSVESEGSVTG